jgi:Sec-independent protein translocase protein TatA
MGLLEHWPLVLLLGLIMLVVFGPKRMIEMGHALAKAARDTMAAMREVDWAALTRGDEPSATTPPHAPVPPLTPPAGRVVEGSAEPEPPNETPSSPQG